MSKLLRTADDLRESPEGRGWVGALAIGIGYMLLTSAIVEMGLLLGSSYLKDQVYSGHRFHYGGEVYANWDGQWYKDIVTRGYRYDPDGYSSVAFFPAYPLVARVLAWLVRMRPETALLITSNAFLAALFCLTGRYAGLRDPEASPNFTAHVLLALGLVPTTFFFRMAYSESMFLTIATLVLYAILRRWPLPVIAGLVGLATATRLVGLALLPPVLLDAWRRSTGPRDFLIRASYLVPIGCWGIISYMAYQQLAFGDFLTFARSQAIWRRRPETGLGRRLLSVVTLEPVWSAYLPWSPAYWSNSARTADPLFSLRAADPAYFVGTVLLVVVGAVKRWLTDYEIVTAAGLLLIPYATIGYDQYMQSMGRYSAAALPIYLVLGQLLCRLPGPAVALLAAISGFLLGTYSALFAAWYVFL